MPDKITRYEYVLANALKRHSISFKANPEIWLSSCQFYTPDFVIYDRLIVEVDGGIHTAHYRKTPDRIRQRVLENLGFSVLRVTNRQIVKHLDSVVELIQEEANKLIEQKAKVKHKAYVIYKPQGRPIPKDISCRLNEWAIEISSLLKTERDWNAKFFEEYLSRKDNRIMTCPCSVIRILEKTMGLQFRPLNGDKPDFVHYSNLFRLCREMMRDLFGENADIDFVNDYCISAANNLKNIIFKGMPDILYETIFESTGRPPERMIGDLNDYDELESFLDDFNSHFSKLGVTVEMAVLKAECAGYLAKLSRNQTTSAKQQFAKYQWMLK